jgi:exosortase/archaeosortase family protein
MKTNTRTRARDARDRRQMRRMLLVYVLALGALAGAYAVLSQIGALTPLLAINTRAAAAQLGLIGYDIEVTGEVIRSSRFALAIVPECTALAATGILAAGIAAVPAGWKGKLSGLFVGILVLTSVNFFRIATLFVVGTLVPAVYDIFHLVLWQAVMVLLAVAIWVVWTRRWSHFAA